MVLKFVEMKEIDIEELKGIQVEMLVLIDEFCVRNNINYSLSSGTLIGAVRHKGYIPWDDDIDIMMPRSDYDRFVTTFNGTFSHLSLLAPELDLNYYAPYANVYDNRTLLTEDNNDHRGLNIGIKIDVFPIDTVSTKASEYANDMRKVEKLNLMMHIKRLKILSQSRKQMTFYEIAKILILKFFCIFFSYPFLQKKIKNIALNQRYIDSEYVDNVVFNIYSKKCTRFNKSVMEHFIRMPFENKEFSVINDYDVVLRKMYGDYMKLPPEEQRIPHHNFKAYWNDRD